MRYRIANLGNYEVHATPAELRPLLTIPAQPGGVQRAPVGLRHVSFVLAEVAHPLTRAERRNTKHGTKGNRGHRANGGVGFYEARGESAKRSK